MNAPPKPVPAIWTTGSTEAIKTGTWRAALPIYRRAPSPCHLACPVNGQIAVWLDQARRGDFHAAWTTLTENNPFPAIAGRICHHPCETACNRASYDESLAICRLERHVGDRAIAEGWRHADVAVTRKERIAVVGGGPSGLSAAYHLRRRGYAVTIFEAQAALGGLMRDGIPPYRLAREVLDAEIQRILDLGVQVRCGSTLATPADFERLRADYDAIYLAMGARRQKRLAQLDYSRPWVMDGAVYLAHANAGTPPALGRRLVVIGGGSAAMDAARSARRAGHEVRILALEPEARLPAQREEVIEAREERIELVDAAMLESVQADTGGALRLRCVRVHFEAGPVRGQFSVTPVPGSEFTLEADAIVASIGQDPELAPVQALLETDGTVLRTDPRQATSVEGVFAGGDVASNARFVTEAIGMGKRAAQQIDARLRGGASAPTAGTEPVVSLDAINTFYHPKAPRAPERRLAPGPRLESGIEVQLGLDPGAALAESARCFSCGNCILCDNCFHYCPDLAIKRVPGGYEVATDYCKGCGACVRECPTGSMVMREEIR